MSASIAIISATRRVWMSSMRALASDQSLNHLGHAFPELVAVALTGVWLVMTSGTGPDGLAHAVRYTAERSIHQRAASVSELGARVVRLVDPVRTPCQEQ